MVQNDDKESGVECIGLMVNDPDLLPSLKRGGSPQGNFGWCHWAGSVSPLFYNIT